MAKRFHCWFEQSGTFKNEFKKLGFEAYDYDILNDFNETDYQVDLFREIEKAYRGGQSIMDNYGPDDMVLAFFPCVRFETQITLWYKGKAKQQKNWSDERKLEHCIKLHEELHRLYCLITKMAHEFKKRGIKAVIENPFSVDHYLTRYWPLEPALVDKNRRDRGDYQIKPTQFWFINREPSYNFIFEPQVLNEYRTHNHAKARDGKSAQVMRSMISHDYASRFIREFII